MQMLSRQLDNESGAGAWARSGGREPLCSKGCHCSVFRCHRSWRPSPAETCLLAVACAGLEAMLCLCPWFEHVTLGPEWQGQWAERVLNLLYSITANHGARQAYQVRDIVLSSHCPALVRACAASVLRSVEPPLLPRPPPQVQKLWATLAANRRNVVPILDFIIAKCGEDLREPPRGAAPPCSVGKQVALYLARVAPRQTVDHLAYEVALQLEEADRPAGGGADAGGGGQGFSQVRGGAGGRSVCGSPKGNRELQGDQFSQQLTAFSRWSCRSWSSTTSTAPARPPPRPRSATPRPPCPPPARPRRARRRPSGGGPWTCCSTRSPPPGLSLIHI